jgi:hypothetical protein
MKILLSISVFLLSGYLSNAQVMPEAFLGMMPSIPDHACMAIASDKEEFNNQVDSIRQMLRDELERRNDANQAKAESKEPEMQANMMKQSGMSPADIQRMQAMQKSNKSGGKQQKEMSDAETKAMVDQMLQQNYNVSMDEIEKVQNMDDNEKKAWVTSYASEKQTEVNADPGKYEQERVKNMNSYELLAEQKGIMDSLNEQQIKYAKMFDKLEKDTTGLVNLKQIDKLQSQLTSLMGIDYGQGPKMEALSAQIKSEKTIYCNKFTPTYLDILNQYLIFTKSSLRPYYRLEVIQNQITKSQTGVDLDLEKGHLGLNQVHDYLNKLNGAYKYNLFNESE